jgi:hypothetical protein
MRIVHFDIEFISDIRWSAEGDDPMSKLILGATDIDILKALSRTHGDIAPVVWSADFIPGKGEGQIFLLHGKDLVSGTDEILAHGNFQVHQVLERHIQ